MLDAGFITIYRKITEWEWYNDLAAFKLFFHLLLTVNWHDAKWRNVDIKRGQRLCSIDTLAQETHLSVQQIRTAIKHLKSTRDITSETIRVDRSGCTLFTVVNYDKYQSCEGFPTSDTTSEQQTTNKRLTSEQQQMNKYNKYNKYNNTGRGGTEAPTTAPEKVCFCENVLLTEKQYELLAEKYGDKKRDELIKTLADYKHETGKVYDSDYHAIITWVPQRLQRLQSEIKSESMAHSFEGFSLSDFAERPD